MIVCNLKLKYEPFTVEVHNISLSPNNGQLTLRENLETEVMCEINNNAVPPPTITWFLGTKYISSTEGTYTTSINITGNREDNTQTLQCKATNNNKPPKTAVTTINVECKYGYSVQHC